MAIPARRRRARARRGGERVAHFPFETGQNPYQSLFYGALAQEGIALDEVAAVLRPG